MKNKGQVLILVFFLMLLAGILSVSLSSLWQGEIRTKGQGRYAAIAFYLAQAAIERGKTEVLYGYWPPPSGVFSITDQNDLDNPADNFQFLYTINIDNSIAVNSRTITGIGRVLDMANNEIAYKQIEIVVGNIIDSDLNGQDDDLSGIAQSFSWQEI